MTVRIPFLLWCIDSVSVKINKLQSAMNTIERLLGCIHSAQRCDNEWSVATVNCLLTACQRNTSGSAVCLCEHADLPTVTLIM